MNQQIVKSSMSRSAYIHIPFCEHICFYCDFNKVFLEGQPVDEYIEALLKEMRLTLEIEPTTIMETIYIGGGTPTSLTSNQLDRLLGGIQSIFPMKAVREFTVEANPGDLTFDKLKVMQAHGVNRLSMGVQSFNDQLLKKIGRKHSVQDVYDTMRVIEKAGMTNVSIDLIYALPNQTVADFEDTLDQALSLDLPHYSMYSLILENKTQFYNWVRQGRLLLPDDDLAADMFDLAIDKMLAANRHQYEVSNFSVPGKESQHNLVYWKNEHYYGFGAGASGYLNQTRYRNHGPIQHYLKPLRKNQLPIIEKEPLTRLNQIEEEMFLGLRKKVGISKTDFLEKFGESYETFYAATTAELVAAGLMEVEGDAVRLSRRGFFLGNEVFEKFLFEKKQK